MATEITRRGESHRHGGENHRDQRGEAQELFRPLQRLPHLRPQIADILHPLTGLQLGLQPLEVTLERIARRQIGDEQAIGGAVAGLQQIGRRHIVDMDQQARPDGEQAARDLGLLLHDRTDFEHRVADGERVADPGVESRRESRVGPGFAARWNSLRRRPAGDRGVDQIDRAAQRITGSHRLDIREHRAAGGRLRARAAHHAVESQYRGRDETARRRFRGERFRQWPIARNQYVGSEQQVGLLRQRALDAIREESDGADAGDREHHRRDQDGELAGAPIARQHAPGESQRIHRSAFTSARCGRRRPGVRRRAKAGARSDRRARRHA